MNVVRTVKAAGKIIAKAAAGAVGSRVVSEAFKHRPKRLPGRSGGSHSSQPGHSAWLKPKSKKRKRGKKSGRSRKPKCVTRRDVLRMINKADEMPKGEHQYLVTGISPPLSNLGQTVMFTDVNGIGFFMDYFRAWDAASTLWNGKVAQPNTAAVGAFNTPLDTPIKCFKQYAEFRMVNNGLLQLEIDLYVAIPKINTDSAFVETWAACYNDIKYVPGGTSGTMSNRNVGDYYANPGQVPNLKKFWSFTKQTFNLLPGETRKEIVKGFSGKFLPNQFSKPSSTLGLPQQYSYVPGSKQVFFVIRNIISSTTLGTQPRHLATLPGTQGGFEVEVLYRTFVECPESIPVASRQQALSVVNWSILAGTDGTGITANVYNPSVLTSNGS